MTSEITSVFREVVMLQSWERGARAETVPRGATGDSSIASNPSGSLDQASASQMLRRCGDNEEGRTNRLER